MAFHDWFAAIQRSATLVVPEVADFEVRRELLRAGRELGLSRLERLGRELRYEHVTPTVWRLAARLWAESRNRGRPTADPRELDADVILAATAISLRQGDVLIATTKCRAPLPVRRRTALERISPD